MPETGRRGFIYGVMATVGGLMTVWFAFLAERFMLPPPPATAKWQYVGDSTEFLLNNPILKVYTGINDFPDGVFVVRLAQGLTAYDVHCAHLQCTVVWVGATSTFDCPCHGSVYTLQDKVIAGPAPHGLHKHAIRETAGKVYIGGFIS